MSELDMETPEGDAFEQRQEIIADETATGARHEIPLDVDEADAAEQERAVGFDDDDYRLRRLRMGLDAEKKPRVSTPETQF